MTYYYSLYNSVTYYYSLYNSITFCYSLFESKIYVCRVTTSYLAEHKNKHNTATCKINESHSDGAPVVNWYISAVENRWKFFSFILQVAV